MRGRGLEISGWCTVGLVALYVVLHPWLLYQFPRVLWPASADLGAVALLGATFAYVRYTAKQVAADRAALVRADLSALHDVLVNNGGVLRVIKSEHAGIPWEDENAIVKYGDFAKRFGANGNLVERLLFSARERRPRVPAHLRPKVTAFENAVMAANRAAGTLVVCIARVVEDAGGGDSAFLTLALEKWSSVALDESYPEVPLDDVKSGAVFDRAIESWRELRDEVEAALDLK